MMKSQEDFIDYNKLDKIIIGIVGGDGIGPLHHGSGSREYWSSFCRKK